MSRSFAGGGDCSDEQASATPHCEVPRRRATVEITIGIDLGEVWSHYYTLNMDGVVVDRGRFRTTPKAIETWFIDVPHARVAMEAGSLDLDLRTARGAWS